MVSVRGLVHFFAGNMVRDVKNLKSATLFLRRHIATAISIVCSDRHCVFLSIERKYRESSGYDGLDLRCFEVTNVPHKNVKNDVE